MDKRISGKSAVKKGRIIILSAVLQILLSGCGAEIPESQAALATATPETSAVTETTTVTTTSETTAATTEMTTTAAEETDYIGQIIADMTKEEKAGQLLLARYPQADGAEIMSEYHLGGYTFYAADFENRTAEEMTELIDDIQEVCGIPAFMAVDEEGGAVVRVSKWSQFRTAPFSSQNALGKGGEELIEAETDEKSKLLRSLGINLNLAPVADYTDNKWAYIYNRTFGKDPETTGEYIALTVNVMNENSIGSCLKHFPGYGDNVDTHTGVATDTRAADEFEAADFIPFRYGIDAGATAVMVNHNIVTAFDSERPASVSPEVHRILREKLGFEGVIVTDDMGMDAMLSYVTDESVYVAAVLAGNDLICTSDIPTAYNDILAALNDGRISEEVVDESIRRILSMKISLGLIDIGDIEVQ